MHTQEFHPFDDASPPLDQDAKAKACHELAIGCWKTTFQPTNKDDVQRFCLSSLGAGKPI
jgi:hypothetical protein